MRSKRRRLQFEPLEARDVPAVVASLSNGVLAITGTPAADTITVRQTSSQLTVDGVAGTFAVGSVNQVAIDGRDGNDVIDIRGVTKPVTIDGGAGSDRFLIDPASVVKIPGYTSADRIEFSNPAGVQSWSVRSSDGTVYVLDTDGEFRASGSLVDGGVSSFEIAPSGRVYALMTSGLFMASDVGYNPDFWSIDSGVASFALAPSGRVYALKSNGLLMGSDDGLPGHYCSIDSGVKEVAVSPSGRVYALKTSGLFMASDVGYSPYFWSIDSGVASFTLAPSGRVYALKTSGLLMGSDDGRPGYYSSIDSGVKEVAVSPSGRVYALKTSGLLMASDIGYAPYFWTVATDVTSFTLAADGTPQVVSLLARASVPVWSADRSAIQFRNTNVYFNPYDWAKDGYRPQDITQQLSGICVIAATLASAANAGLGLGSRIHYLGNFTYQVYLYEFGWQTVWFDGTVYTSDLKPNTTGTAVVDGRTVTRLKDFWPLLFARAYLQAQGVNWATDPGPNDKFWDNGFLGFRPAYVSPKNAGYDIAGGDKNNWDTSEGMTAIRHLADNLRLGSVITVSTYSAQYGAKNGSGHQWAVLGLYQSGGVYYVDLYNPWGGPGSQMLLTWQQFASGFETITMVTRAGVSY
jgi:hypothetical protein